MIKNVLYFHGLESLPGGEKVHYLSYEVDWVKAPAMDYRDPEVFEDWLDYVKREEPDLIIGSSMGGYVATAASNHPNVKGLFVLAPAYYIEGFDHSLIDSISVPFEIVHGWHDDIVPVENSIRFAQSEHGNLHILNGNHGLTENLDDINLYFQQFLKRIE